MITNTMISSKSSLPFHVGFLASIKSEMKISRVVANIFPIVLSTIIVIYLFKFNKFANLCIR